MADPAERRVSVTLFIFVALQPAVTYRLRPFHSAPESRQRGNALGADIYHRRVN